MLVTLHTLKSSQILRHAIFGLKKLHMLAPFLALFAMHFFTGPLESFTLAIPRDLPDSAIQIVEIFVKSPVKVGAQSGFGVLAFQKPANMFTRNYSLRL